jgi:hypothetical protein
MPHLQLRPMPSSCEIPRHTLTHVMPPCYDPGPPNFHFPPAPIATAPPAPVKPPRTQIPAPVRPSMPPCVPIPPHETQYQRQLQDAWEEGYDSVMKSSSHHACTPSPSRTVHMKSPSPTPTHVILPLPHRRTSPKQPIVTPPPASPPMLRSGDLNVRLARVSVASALNVQGAIP